ncbi:hypothetical protein CICLE_v10017303mg [Citrus x clementina]|uniref:Uncharacterized protein n=2 Tax=Citrus TaxID=2706 RepID=V4U4C3_CITCL|nr:hypothetical protein CICLE_v10017303mg [Citrus x clementina]GAY63079.1 hypothetical protein CUMW_222750 [Citrus unshiu]
MLQVQILEYIYSVALEDHIKNKKTIHLTKDSRVKVTFIFIFTKLIQYQKIIKFLLFMKTYYHTYCLKLSCHSPCRINGCKSFNHKHVIEGYER